MTDPKNISPLLDGFKLGAPICEHHGIVCCPAIKEDSSKKYIVKIISVPANQSQLDALLLAGAYKDPADAMDYFRRKGERILEEAEHLTVLSKLEGFLPYDGWQMEPITRHRLGYEIYLVGSYKRSLEKYMRKTAFTHLEAVNLGLDLCSALSVCRQSGYIYADLKPSNIYVSETKEYRIGDLGFLSLDSLRYASLPEQYHSSYTPPELLDPMTPINLSVDTYAVGMILYQLYNDGQLPNITSEQAVPSPIHADYEMAEIITKAISIDPEQRWLDPKDMGKAIASYMQRNSVNNIPITPFIPLDVVPEEVVPAAEKKLKHRKTKRSEETNAAEETENQTAMPAADIPTAEPEKAPTTSETIPQQLEETPSSCIEQVTEETTAPETTPEEAPSIAEYGTKISEIPLTEETSAEEVSLEITAEEAVVEEPKEVISQDISDEVVKIITKADDLIAYEIPEEVMFPTEPEIDPFAFIHEDEDEYDLDPSDEDLMEETAESAREIRKHTKHFADKTRGKKFRKFLGVFFGIAFAAAVSVGGFWYYQNIYLLAVDAMTITGTQDQITVLIDTSADESRLFIHCSDSKGNRTTESVRGGKVTFLNLKPSTEYTIDVESSGFHKLIGKTTEVFKTESTTQILTFDAIAGSEDGSVMLEFTVEGGEPDFWNIRYSADGEEEKRETITNHSTMITGLTVGKLYTFTLDGGKDFDLSGNKQLQFMASKLILAENMTVQSNDGSNISVRWKAPGDVVVDHWKVRCYDGYGFEEECTVTDTQVLLNGLDPAVSYIVEVTASGMTQPARINITADPISVSAFHLDESKQTKLNITWDVSANASADGWILMYTVDGSGSQIIECKQPEASITPLLPGATYSFTLESADGRTVYNNFHSYTTVAAEKFADNGMKLEDVTFNLLKTPVEESWTCDDFTESSYADTFAVGDSVSLAIKSASTFYMPGYETKVLYVIRNAYNNVLPELVSEETYYWKNIWQAGNPQNSELTIPKLPSVPGDYVLQLYFNGKTVAEIDFHITE